MNFLDAAHHSLREAERAIEVGDLHAAIDRALAAHAYASVSSEREPNPSGAELVLTDVNSFFHNLLGSRNQ